MADTEGWGIDSIRGADQSELVLMLKHREAISDGLVSIGELKIKNTKLREYIQHKTRCVWWINRPHCDCGLYDILKGPPD